MRPDLAIQKMNLLLQLMIRCAPFAAAIFLAGCDRGTPRKVTTDTGYKGTARSQPYLAAQRMFEKLDWEVKIIHSIHDLPRRGTLILTGTEGSAHATAMRTVEWAEKSGGHLILMLRRTESWRDDWDSYIGDLFTSKEELNLHPVLKKLKATVADSSGDFLSTGDKQEVKIRGKKLSMEFRSNLTLDAREITPEPEVLVGKISATPLFSVRAGYRGRITVVCDGSPFRNRYLDQQDHATILNDLVNLTRRNSDLNYSNYDFAPRQLHFLMSANDSFMSILWEKYWMALIALGILIIAWLWKNFPRFGPLQAADDPGVRQFSEHLKMTGNFLWHHHQSANLFPPMRRSILRKLQLRSGSIPPDDDADVIERLAAMSRLPSERVASAWQAVHVADGKHFLTIIQDLQTIEHSL